MQIASWNVNSIGARLPIVTEWLKEQQPDILCLQETKTPDEKFPRAVFEELGYELVIAGQKSYNGVAILSRHPLTLQHNYLPYDRESGQQRLISAQVKDLNVNIINVYIPNGSEVGAPKFNYKLGWLADLKQFLETHYNPMDPVLICGDFNICPGELDVFDVKAMTNQVGFHPDECEALEAIRGWGLIDTFRLHQPDLRQFSWWDYRMNSFVRNRGLRIDHIWVTELLAQRCTRAWIDPAPRELDKPSDHTPVVAEFR